MNRQRFTVSMQTLCVGRVTSLHLDTRVRENWGEQNLPHTNVE